MTSKRSSLQASISLNVPTTISAGAAPTSSGLNVTFPSSFGPIPEFYNALLTQKPYQVVLVNMNPPTGAVGSSPSSVYILSNAIVNQVTGGDAYVSRDYSVHFVATQLTIQSWLYNKDGTLAPPSGGSVSTWDFSKATQIPGK